MSFLGRASESSVVDPLLAVHAGGRTVRVRLSETLTPDAAEEAERAGNAWIKSLRSALVEERRFRDRFGYRGDSLWWFAELYLHKTRTMAQVFATQRALEALLARETAQRLDLLAGDRIARTVAPLVAARLGVAYQDLTPARPAGWRLALEARLAPHVYAASPFVRRWRARLARQPAGPADVVAFVHSAFWREDRGDDTYVGPVLHALAARLPAASLCLVGVGPSTNFRVRTWRRRIDDFREARETPASLVPIEALAPAAALEPSRAVWRARGTTARALLGSADLRAAARAGGDDVWPLVQADLLGIANRQFPWSARVMDEAAAALDVLRPRVVVTYAEAGGWGRAITLEARRRHIPVVGLQHGFISRHWLNYLHEPDELLPSPVNPSDTGCPLADLTLLYDEFARGHLIEAGRYPADRLRVVGNPRLDQLVAAARDLSPDDLARVRQEAGARADQHLVVLAAKRIPEFDATLGALMHAVRDLPDVHLAVRPHPAESPEPYARLAQGCPNVRLVPGSVGLVALLAAARLVVTINSTVAIEAMLLDVPALAMRLPNYLSPFVGAGAMAGTASLSEIEPAVAGLVRDAGTRARLAAGRHAFLEKYAITADGHAAERAVDAVVGLAQR